MSSLYADLILRNGHLITLDPDERIAEALAARDGRIVHVGSTTGADALQGPETTVIDLEGRTGIPGIVDSHCHPDSYAARIHRWVEVGPTQVTSLAGLLECIADRSSRLAGDEWFLGYRLNENKSGGYPDWQSLDQASGGRPVFILRTDGHLGLANSAAFAACGISGDATDPPHGRFDRHPETGAFTGLVRETAAHVFLEHIHAEDTVAGVAAGLGPVFDEFLAHGVTTVYNSLTGATGIRAYQRLHATGALPMRVGIIVSGREHGLVEAYIAAGIESGFGDDWLRVIGVEWCPDCSTSGRTAAYYQPYQGTAVAGEPTDNRGMLLYDAADLAGRVTAAHRAGLQVMVEGVGDRGIDFALDALEAALADQPVTDHRMRVEHCCHATPAIIDRLARLGAVSSSATGFMYELGDAYIANRGSDAMRWMWPHRSYIDRGVPAPGHSDAWVCSPNPFTAMWSMVNRRTDTRASLNAREAVTPMEALRAYTIVGAWSGREERSKGSLEAGKLADVAVLDRDLLSIPTDDIREVQVELTVVGGNVRYRAPHRQGPAQGPNRT